jgi:ATP-dependent helicase HrpA
MSEFVILYPPELPITRKRAEIVGAVRAHPVVIVSGETGCGKSTQIPKMCLEAGRGRRGRIACTQPRRIAAITIAQRIAEELGEPVGRTVGYKIRFDERTSRDTLIKVLTDGMLLAETQSDPRLREYDTLIIDEAHERSLNIDFLLGIAKTLLHVRPDLRLIITSATLDIEKFSRAFEDAPVLEVSGRLYPVEVDYRPPRPEDAEGGEADYVQMAADAVDDLKKGNPAGDILVFMPTEQDILETCEILEGRRYAGVTVLPLFGRLPGAQQGRVYTVTGPKIVVATNVAETSLTIPGIRYVVDTGLARISQYLPGARINSLPIQAVSKSSADQRKGRCGRVDRGLCVRLYAEDDYAARVPFTPPEILRSNLAEVILRMIDLNLGHPLKFPFVDRPHPKNVEDGYETLVELGAIERRGQEAALTEKGRQMARMPLDPRISRMLLEARKEGCLRETAVIASALSIRDPRERPPEKAAQADAMHAPFRDPDSDFLTLLNIWNRYHGDLERQTSHAQKRTFCRDHFLSFARMREWTFIHNEILDILRELRIPPGRTQRVEMSRPLYAAVHKSILSGYLSNIATHKDRNMYTADKGREVMAFPGSTLFNKNASWIVAAEMVRTSRLFARTAARIEAGWLEALGGPLCRYSYVGPHWDKGRGQVVAEERVSLFGLEIVTGRTVPYGPVAPDEAHRIFLRSALVEGQVKEHFDFLRLNLDLVARLSTIEEKLRRHDILVDEKMRIEFYAKRLAGVFDVRGLKERIRRPGGDAFLNMRETDLLRAFPDPRELALFPDELSIGGRRFRLKYKFAPGEEDDGATIGIPAELAGRIPAEPLEWGIPGHLRDKIMELIKGLPKRFRKLLVPSSDAANLILHEIQPSEASLFETLSRLAKQRFRADIPAAEWAQVELPKHLRLRVAVLDPQGKEVVASRDLETVRKARREAARAAAQDPRVWAQGRQKWERTGITGWDFGDLPELVSIGPGAVAYPGLEAGANGANLRLFKTYEEALTSHKKGVQTLLLLKFAKDLKFMERRLVLPVEYQRAALYFGGKETVERMLVENLKTAVFQKDIRSAEEFKAYADTVVRALFEKAHALWEAARPVLAAYQEIHAALYTIERTHASNKVLAGICRQVRQEIDRLVSKNFLEIYAIDRLTQIPRYLSALRLRLERAKNDPEKDLRKAAQIGPFVQALETMRADIGPQTPVEIRDAVEEFRWIVEEFKVSVFAPELKTAFPVSAKRLSDKIREIEKIRETI